MMLITFVHRLFLPSKIEALLMSAIYICLYMYYILYLIILILEGKGKNAHFSDSNYLSV